jgi:hypothetical protein
LIATLKEQAMQAEELSNEDDLSYNFTMAILDYDLN